jgi:hypothetical protein
MTNLNVNKPKTSFGNYAKLSPKMFAAFAKLQEKQNKNCLEKLIVHIFSNNYINYTLLVDSFIQLTSIVQCLLFNN